MITILCKRDGLWRKKFEEKLSENLMEHVTLLAVGKMKIEVLEYLNKRNDLLIVKMEAKYMKNRKKGLGLKIWIVKKQPKINKP